MTGQLIAPVIPPAAGPAHTRPGRAGGGHPLPLAAPLALPAGAVYGLSRIDASGRLTCHAISHVLNWQPGDRLTLTADAGVVVVHRDPGGMVTVPPRCSITIPAPLRHRCGLRPGDQVLLAALPGEDMLVAYSFAVVDQALQARPLFPRHAGGLHLPVHAAGTPLVPQAVLGNPHPPWRPIGERDAEHVLDEIDARGPRLIALSGHDSTPWTYDAFNHRFGDCYRTLRAGEELRVTAAST